MSSLLFTFLAVISVVMAATASCNYEAQKGLTFDLSPLMNNQQDYYVIVTAYLASRVVPDICDECGFPMERSFRCERNFILPEDLMKAPVVAEEIS